MRMTMTMRMTMGTRMTMRKKNKKKLDQKTNNCFEHKHNSIV